MSKTVDELILVFEKARAEAAPFPQHHEDGLYAGIAAVVRALRDEMAINSCACKFWLDDILASDGVEARPVCPTCKGALFGPYDPSDRTPCPECTPAAAPSAQSDVAKAFEAEMRKAVSYKPGFPAAAPDVCVWERDRDACQMVSACHLRTDCSPYFFIPKGPCPECGKPISFKEAAR